MRDNRFPRRRFLTISGFQKPVRFDVWVIAVWLMRTFEVNHKTIVFKFAGVKRCLKNERFHWTDARYCRFCKKLFCDRIDVQTTSVLTCYDVRVVTRCLRTFLVLYFPRTKLMYCSRFVWNIQGQVPPAPILLEPASPKDEANWIRTRIIQKKKNPRVN